MFFVGVSVLVLWYTQHSTSSPPTTGSGHTDINLSPTFSGFEQHPALVGQPEKGLLRPHEQGPGSHQPHWRGTKDRHAAGREQGRKGLAAAKTTVLRTPFV